MERPLDFSAPARCGSSTVTEIETLSRVAVNVVDILNRPEMNLYSVARLTDGKH